MSNGEARWWNRIVKDLMPNGWQDRGKDYALEVDLTSGLLTRKWQFGRHEITPSGVFHLWDHFWLIGHLSMQFEGLKRSRYLYGCVAEIRGKFSISYSAPDALGWKIRWRYFHVNCFGKSMIQLQSESSPSQCGWQLYRGEPVDCLEEVPSAPPERKVLALAISKVVISTCTEGEGVGEGGGCTVRFADGRIIGARVESWVESSWTFLFFLQNPTWNIVS